MIHEDCFAYMTAKGRAHCVALKELYCKKEDCKWYKPKEQREVKQTVGDAKQRPVLKTYRNEVDTEYIDCLFRNEAKGYYELYKAIGIGHATYYTMMEGGQASKATLIKISKYFNVEPETLLRKG